MVPQNANFNRGEWKSLENRWATGLEAGRTVDVNISVKYAGDGVRPDRLQAKYSIDGERPVTVNFDNAPGGTIQ